MALFRVRLSSDDSSYDHACLQHAQLTDSAAAHELSGGNEQRFAKYFLQ